MTNLLRLNQIKTSGDDEGKEVVSGSELQFVDSDALALTQIAEVKLDSTKGILVFIKRNGEIINVSGFPTASMFGEGQPGSRGAPGNKGRDGRNGRDGSTGTRGNTGNKGVQGDKGIDGDDGNDGEDGDEGYRGNQGNPGNQGSIGKDGEQGPDGPVGDPGASCIAGAKGATGPAPRTTVLVAGGDLPPTDKTVFAWCFPISTTNPIPALPSVPALFASVSDIDMIATRVVAGNDLFSASAYLPVNVRGGSGTYSYRWSINVAEIALKGNTERTVQMIYSGRVDPGKTITIDAILTCVVTDSGQTSRPAVTVTSAVKLVARNAV